MGPKAVSKPKAATEHGTYKDMIKVAIFTLKERNGSSRQAIKKYIAANNKLGSTDDAALSRHVNHAIQAGVKSGDFTQPKGASGTVKLAKPVSKPAAPKPAAPKAKAATAAPKPKSTKPAAAKKTPAPKKPAATKTAKKPAAVKKTAAAPKATATKTKANVAKPRKTAKKATSATPAVEEKKPAVLGKTKSGRVTKSTAPAAKKAAPKKEKTAPKKAGPKKA